MRIHWTTAALKPCITVLVQFFWGEAEWGLTFGLRKLRRVRLAIAVLGTTCIVLVSWAVVERALADNNRDAYSYYEGKVLEERVVELSKRMVSQSDDIKRLLEMANTSTLLAVRMQAQMEKQQDLLDAGVKVLGALVVTPVLAILWSIFKSGLRKERPHIAEHIDKERKGP